MAMAVEEARVVALQLKIQEKLQRVHEVIDATKLAFEARARLAALQPAGVKVAVQADLPPSMDLDMDVEADTSQRDGAVDVPAVDGAVVTRSVDGSVDASTHEEHAAVPAAVPAAASTEVDIDDAAANPDGADAATVATARAADAVDSRGALPAACGDTTSCMPSN